MTKCNLHHLVKGDQHLVVDGTRTDARVTARALLGVGAVVLFAGQMQCNGCGKCH